MHRSYRQCRQCITLTSVIHVSLLLPVDRLLHCWLAGATLPGAGQLALAVAVAAGVTATRTALLAAWPEFKEASDRSNQQVSCAGRLSWRVLATLWLRWQARLLASKYPLYSVLLLARAAAAAAAEDIATQANSRNGSCSALPASLVNPQVLAPLAAADLLWVAALPAISEELLFRGALIPAVYPDW